MNCKLQEPKKNYSGLPTIWLARTRMKQAAGFVCGHKTAQQISSRLKEGFTSSRFMSRNLLVTHVLFFVDTSRGADKNATADCLLRWPLVTCWFPPYKHIATMLLLGPFLRDAHLLITTCTNMHQPVFWTSPKRRIFNTEVTKPGSKFLNSKRNLTKETFNPENTHKKIAFYWGIPSIPQSPTQSKKRQRHRNGPFKMIAIWEQPIAFNVLPEAGIIEWWSSQNPQALCVSHLKGVRLGLFDVIPRYDHGKMVWGFPVAHFGLIQLPQRDNLKVKCSQLQIDNSLRLHLEFTYIYHETDPDVTS